MDYGEERWILTGKARGRLLVVVYTVRFGRFRIISAREAEKDEQERYYRQGGEA